MPAIELNSTPLISDANLVYYWRMESNSSATVGSNTGTETSVTHPTGKFGNGIHFNASSARVLFPTLPTGTSGTISFWTKYTGTANEMIFSVSNSATSNRLQIGHSGLVNANIEFLGGAASNVNVLGWSANTTTNDGNWHHFVVTTAGSGVKFYIDGIDRTSGGTYSAGNSSTNFWFDSITGANNFYMGAVRYNNTGPFLFFSGDMDDIAIFSRALTATEISNLYSGTWPPSTKPAFLLNFVN